MQLQISIRESREVTILDLCGRLTLGDGGSRLLSRHVRQLLDGGVRELVLNLEKLTQVDSSSISVFVETYLSLENNGGGLKFLRPRGRVKEVLELVRLLDLIPYFEQEAQALDSFATRIYSEEH